MVRRSAALVLMTAVLLSGCGDPERHEPDPETVVSLVSGQIRMLARVTTAFGVKGKIVQVTECEIEELIDTKNFIPREVRARYKAKRLKIESDDDHHYVAKMKLRGTIFPNGGRKVQGFNTESWFFLYRVDGRWKASYLL